MRDRKKNTILFVGTFSHTPNVDAAIWLVKEIFPLVTKSYPGAVLKIAGKNPPAALRMAAQETPGVEVLGFVEDLAALLRSCRCFVAPLRFGGGVKVKILHAMAHGIPVVATRIGSEGIEGLSADAILVGDSAGGIARHIGTVLSDDARAERLGKGGWNAMKANYSWNGVRNALTEIYRETIAQVS